MMAGKHALVTGAAGFIGSHLVEMLVREGVQVRAFVRYNSGRRTGTLDLLPADVRQNVEVYYGDLRDREAVQQAAQGVDQIYHLGAVITIPYSYQHPREVVDVNVTGTLNVLLAARDLGTPQVMLTSTSEVYGTAQVEPIDEQHPLHPQSPYAASKVAQDALAISFHAAYDLPVRIVRPFNTFGPRQSARAVIPTIISQALTRDEVRLGALHPTRDLTYVTDTCRGFLLAAESTAAIGRPVNLGTGRSITIGELAELAIRLVGRDVTLTTDAQRIRPEKSEVARLRSDNRLAKELIGWEPQVSLEAGLQRTIDWIRDHLHLFDPERYAY
ncbi:MAG: SDR family NAD(P)-dependent oxidoreductase [Chloroflexi bacterium]|nr:SDR family NAD(P)-dependent oxidoreductase [Chloroflexota bacterium]